MPEFPFHKVAGVWLMISVLKFEIKIRRDLLLYVNNIFGKKHEYWLCRSIYL